MISGSDGCVDDGSAVVLLPKRKFNRDFSSRFDRIDSSTSAPDRTGFFSIEVGVTRRPLFTRRGVCPNAAASKVVFDGVIDKPGNGRPPEGLL